MSADDNVKTVQSFYEAFGRGDLATIIDGLTDDVDWGAETNTTVAPWYGLRRGKKEVEQFFADFGSTMEVHDFTPLSFASSGDEVFALVRCVASSRATGKNVNMILHHYFKFLDGKLAYYRGTEDTAQVAAALAP